MTMPDATKPIIISIGGSLIVPNGGPNVDFLQKLNAFIREEVALGKKFFLVAGGGKLTRHYQDAVQDVIHNISDEDLDWLGVHSTHLNGHLLRTIFVDIANPRMIQNYEKKLTEWNEPVVVAAGWKPGWSTDYDAVLLARDYGAGLMINLSNIDWVYDKDPKKFPDAKPLKEIKWQDMEQFVGNRWSPGLNAPFDPIASQLAEELGLTVIVANGNNFENVKNIIEGREFTGTKISP